MSKMGEYTADVTVRLKKTLTLRGCSLSDIDAQIRAWPEHNDFLGDFDSGDIKDIEVENVERVD